MIRLIYGFKPTDYDSITGLMKSLGWLDKDNSSKLRLLCITYTAIITKEPSYLHDILTLRNDMRCLRSSNKLILLKPHFNLKSFGMKSFSYNAFHLWNDLHFDMRHCSSLNSFKSSMKLLLLLS